MQSAGHVRNYFSKWVTTYKPRRCVNNLQHWVNALNSLAWHDVRIINLDALKSNTLNIYIYAYYINFDTVSTHFQLQHSYEAQREKLCMNQPAKTRQLLAGTRRGNPHRLFLKGKCWYSKEGIRWWDNALYHLEPKPNYNCENIVRQHIL